MPPKRCLTWHPKDVPQSLQNRLFAHQYFTIADVTVREGIVGRVISRNKIIIALEDNSEVQIRLYKVNSKNEPYYWEAKQALHQMFANQKVYFISLGEEAPNTLLADVHLPSGESAAEMLIKYGLASLQHCPKLPRKELKYLIEVENKARAAKRGIWGLDDKNQGPEKLYVNEVLFKQMEYMVCKIDKDSIHMVTPHNFCIEVMIPKSRNVLNTKKQKMVARKCLLNKKMKVELQNFDISANKFTGRVIHSQDAELNALYQNRKVIVKDGIQRSTFTASVIEVLDGNSFTVRFRNRVIENVFLSYIMFPWQCGNMKHLCCQQIQNLKLISMYYTHRLRLYTREFLRKLLIGSSVKVTVDYLDSCKGIYCTMIVSEMNVASLLIQNGYACVDIDHRVCPYRQEYLAAENKAKECETGMHAPSPPLHIDIAWCMDKVLQLLSILKRRQRAIVIVEQVLSPSYIILFSAELGWLFAFSLIDFEEVRRANTGISKRNWKEKITNMIAEMCLQKELSLRATSVDSNGVLHGNLKMGTWNLRKLLLRNTENRISARHDLGSRRHYTSKLDFRKRRITKKYFQYLSRKRDASHMQRIKQCLRRDVKTLAVLRVLRSLSSPYFITNRKKRKTFTTQCHIEHRRRDKMILKLDNIQEKKRGKQKRKAKAPKEKSINQQTEKQKTTKRKKAKQKKQPETNKQMEVVETMKTTVNLQGNKMFKKWKEVKNKVTLLWCRF